MTMTRAPRRCRGCKKPCKKSDYTDLPDGTRGTHCNACVYRARQRHLDKLNAKRIKASWEVSR